jgi:hypothetical protein
MPAGELRERLIELRPELAELLDQAWTVAELAAALFPAGPQRDPRLLKLLSEDPVLDLRHTIQDRPPDPGLRTALFGIREQLWRVAEDAGRLAWHVRENPHATDLTAWLRGLADGVAAALAAGWTPVGYDEDERSEAWS